MNPEQARALLIVVALLMGAAGSAGFVGGRMTAPVPPAEVRIVQIPAPVEVAPIEPPAVLPAPPAPPAVEPDPPVAPPVEVKPPAKPKVDAKPKAQAKPKPRPPAPKKTLPSCDVVKREYETMTWAQQMDAYRRATAQEIAHGRRCLGL